MTLKIEKEAAAGLLLALGYKQAAKWPVDRLQRTLDKIPDIVDDDTEIEDEEAAALLASILSTIENEDKIKVVESEAEEVDEEEDAVESQEETEAEETSEPPEPEKKPKKRRRGRPQKERKAEEEVDETVEKEVEDSETEEESKKKKRGRPKKEKKVEKETVDEKPKKKGRKTKSKAKGKGRSKVLGKYSAGPFVRWLGRQGVEFDGARIVLEGEGCSLSVASVIWELKEKREKCPPADVSKEDMKVLREKYPEAFKVD